MGGAPEGGGRVIDVVDRKTTRGLEITVALSASDVAALENGEKLEMYDPELKIPFTVTPAERADYVLDVGPSAMVMFEVMLTGWLTPFTTDEGLVGGRMTLAGDQGTITIYPRELGTKTPANTTVTEALIEIRGGVTPKKK